MTGSIQDEVFVVAADVFGVDPRSLNASSSPEQVEAWDSVQHLNLVLALESKYGVAFEPEEMEELKNLGQIATLVAAKIS